MRGIAGAREESSAARVRQCEEEIERKQAEIQQQHRREGEGRRAVLSECARAPLS